MSNKFHALLMAPKPDKPIDPIGAALANIRTTMPAAPKAANDGPAWCEEANRKPKAAALAAPTAPEEPKVTAVHGFAMEDDGLYRLGREGRTRVSAPFAVVGTCANADRRGHGILVEFNSAYGRELATAPVSSLHGVGAEAIKSLTDAGLKVEYGQASSLAKYLLSHPGGEHVTLMERAGWNTLMGKQFFVASGAPIGDLPEGHTARLIAGTGSPYGEGGTLPEWRATVSKEAGRHWLLTLMVSTALVGPMLEHIDMPGGGVHLFGKTSKGKTTAISTAASVWGRPVQFIRTWSATTNGLEGAAQAHSGSVLILDELGSGNGREVFHSVYMLANGVGKTRASRTGGNAPLRTWRTSLISTGEIMIADKIEEEGRLKAMAGQTARLIDMPTEGRLSGAFDCGDPIKITSEIATNTATYYGTAGPAFVRSLIDRDDWPAIKRQINEWTASRCPPGTDGQVHRVTLRLATIAIAGELATEAGITGWTAGTASAAAEHALALWIERRPGGSTAAPEDAEFVCRLRACINRYGEARFDHMGVTSSGEVMAVGGRVANDRLGWKSPPNEYLIHKDGWKEIFEGLDATAAAKTLAERGILAKAGNGRPYIQKKVGGLNKHVYVVRIDALEADPFT